ncbi:hypothetical protein [Erwinia sorbitola]|uniref:Uncharacterized protein n=1 Tax=Erwinia sorbitola TaxID=2681984 RepID=A0A6I6EPP2_9GAMM|nr:hypothetical protein [Erwinia sorbitola]MTD27134.1 hypothetical protein [Erwinia sorbitola]QGU88691.1 hypothetical protein GN242_16310 [Erwinia sorbitola]
MAKYMTQPMSAGVHPKITYYRKQSAHPPHDESEKFTADATSDYATTNGVNKDQVEQGTYRSNQGVPVGGIVQEI